MIHLHSLAARKSSFQIVRPLATLIRKTPFSTGGSEVEIEDVCDLHIVESPYPPIQAPPYPPLSEFVMADWQSGNLREKIACVDGSTGQTRTFQDHTTNVAKIAAALKNEFGIKETSTVALFSPNHVDFIPISLGVATTGAKLTPINPLYKIMELVVVLEQSRSEVLISHEATMDVALEAAKHVKCIRHVIIIPGTDGGPVPEGTTSIDDLKKYKHNLKETVRGIHVDGAKHPFLLPYSSGTTGLPKGVCLSHNNLISNLLQFDEIEGMSFPTDHKLISPLPFFHIYGFLVSGLYCAWRGQELITISGRFDLEQFCQLVEEHKPKRAHLVPPILLGLANDPVVDKYDMSSLKMIISAAAPLSSDIEKAVTKRIDSDVKQGWGMSELSPLGTVNSDYNSKTGSIGQLAPSTYGKIVDPKTLKSLKPNEAGELMIKGPQVMLGYLDDPKATAECLTKDGWLRTGDLAYYDEEGFFFITDRIKELIKVRGFQVAPAELEALLLTHDHIKDAAVIGVDCEESGEVPRAYVVMKNDHSYSDKTEDEIREWVKERVVQYKRLEGGVVLTNEIPKSASGKILRRILRDRARHVETE